MTSSMPGMGSSKNTPETTVCVVVSAARELRGGGETTMVLDQRTCQDLFANKIAESKSIVVTLDRQLATATRRSLSVTSNVCCQVGTIIVAVLVIVEANKN